MHRRLSLLLFIAVFALPLVIGSQTPTPTSAPNVVMHFTGISEFIERSNGTFRVLLPNLIDTSGPVPQHHAFLRFVASSLDTKKTNRPVSYFDHNGVSYGLVHLDAETVSFETAKIADNGLKKLGAFDDMVINLAELVPGAKLDPRFDQDAPIRFRVAGQVDIDRGTLTPEFDTTGVKDHDWEFQPSPVGLKQPLCLAQAVALKMTLKQGVSLFTLALEGGELVFKVDANNPIVIWCGNALDADTRLEGPDTDHSPDTHFGLHYKILAPPLSTQPLPVMPSKPKKCSPARGMFDVWHHPGGSNCPPARLK